MATASSPDGREELVRGIDLIGTPLTAFSKIIAAGRSSSGLHGICGAESGLVPVSASSPAGSSRRSKCSARRRRRRNAADPRAAGGLP